VCCCDGSAANDCAAIVCVAFPFCVACVGRLSNPQPALAFGAPFCVALLQWVSSRCPLLICDRLLEFPLSSVTRCVPLCCCSSPHPTVTPIHSPMPAIKPACTCCDTQSHSSAPCSSVCVCGVRSRDHATLCVLGKQTANESTSSAANATLACRLDCRTGLAGVCVLPMLQNRLCFEHGSSPRLPTSAHSHHAATTCIQHHLCTTHAPRSPRPQLSTQYRYDLTAAATFFAPAMPHPAPDALATSHMLCLLPASPAVPAPAPFIRPHAVDGHLVVQPV